MALPHLATSNQQQWKQEIRIVANVFPEVPQKRREMFYEKIPKNELTQFLKN
jgi:hypothetical protein